MVAFWRRVASLIIFIYFLRLGVIGCRRRIFFLSLFCLSLFLFVVIFINLLSCMIIEMMHSWAKETLHYLWTSVSFVFTCFETHVACIVLLALLRFVICSILSNFAETRIMRICFAENAKSWCR